MKDTILRMKKSLDKDCYIAFISANPDYDFAVRQHDKLDFLDDKTLLIHRRSGRTTILNLNLMVGVCIRELF